MRECHQFRWSGQVTIIVPLELVRGNIPERLEQAPRVVPRDPFDCRELDLLYRLPRAAPTDLFGLVEPDDRVRERVVVRIAGATDRRPAATRVGDERLGCGVSS